MTAVLRLLRAAILARKRPRVWREDKSIVLHAQYPYVYICWSDAGDFDGTQCEMAAESGGWYRFEIKGSSATVIFKPNADDWIGQAEDINASAGEWWYDGNALVGTKPTGGSSSGGENENPPDNSDTPDVPDVPNITSPTGVSAISISTEVYLSWNLVNNAASYEIYYGTSSSTLDAQLYTTEKSSYCTVANLNADSTYYFWVKAVSSDGIKSAFSDVASCTTESDTATVYFVGSSTASNSTGFNNIYIGNYGFGDLFVAVKKSKELSAGVVDGPHKIKAGTYLLKFGNPATGNVTNSYHWSVIHYTTGQADRKTERYDEDYEFYFAQGGTYTIAKESTSFRKTDKRTKSTTRSGSHTISIKEGID